MSITKCTMLIELATNKTANLPSNRIGGWSESYYRDTFAGLQTLFEGLCTKRAALLPNGAVVVGQRYQLITGGSGSFTTAVRRPGSSAVQCDVPQMALLCRSSGSGVPNVRSLILRGIPDRMVTQGEWDPTSGYNTALINYFDELRLSLWKFRGRDRTQTQAPILTIDNTGAFVLASPGLVLSAGAVVQVMRSEYVDDKTLASGFFTLSSTASATTGIMPLWGTRAAQGGSMRLAGTTYPNFNQTSISRIIVKKVGRPFTSYRGRASNQQ